LIIFLFSLSLSLPDHAGRLLSSEIEAHRGILIGVTCATLLEETAFRILVVRLVFNPAEATCCMHIFVVIVVIVILVVVVTVGVVVAVVVLVTYLFSLSFLPSYFLVCAEWCTVTRSFYFLERVHQRVFRMRRKISSSSSVLSTQKRFQQKNQHHAEEKNKLTKAHLQKNLFSPHAYPRQEKILLSYDDDDDDDDDVEHAALHSLGKDPECSISA